MRAEIKQLVDEIQQSLELLGGSLTTTTRRAARRAERADQRPKSLERRQGRAGHGARARRARGSSPRSHAARVDDAVGMIELAEAESDQGTHRRRGRAARPQDRAARRGAEALLSGEADTNDAYVEIQPGAGGTESQDWAQMLERIYVRWAEGRGYKVEIVEESPGEEAGIKSATVRVAGPNAYGWLKTEMGVHRLVRISPFDSNARRQTSFASVGVYPVVDDTIDIQIKEADVNVILAPRAPAGSTSTRPRARCA